MQAAITRGLRTAPPEAGTSANLWLDTVGRRLAFDGLDRDILALLLFYALDDRVEHLADAVSTARGGPNCLRCDHPLLAMLLAASPGEVEARLHPDARLRASGLVHLDDNGDLNVSARLARLVRGSTTPGADPFAQLLGGGLAATLPWDAFAHLGREAEVAAAVLSATLAGRERGTNILLYGPPGTGKTTFAAALAQRVGATLRPVAEQDDAGGEPNRWERLNGLRLAQRLAPPGDTLLLFDEAEDLFVRAAFGDDGLVASSRVFMHRLLELTPVPVIWTANDITVLGPAVLRRMTMCLELKIPGIAVRTRLWRSMGEEAGVPLAEADAARLARLVPTAPAVASTALRATRLAGGDAGTARLIVEGIARAVRGRPAQARPTTRPWSRPTATWWPSPTGWPAPMRRAPCRCCCPARQARARAPTPATWPAAWGWKCCRSAPPTCWAPTCWTRSAFSMPFSAMRSMEVSRFRLSAK